MSRQASKFRVGLFVIVGLFIACAALVYLGAQSYFKGAVTYVTYFAESVQGLQVDSVVKYRGVEVGRVRKLGVAPDNTLIEVVMDIGFQGPLGNDMAARLKQVGITGLAYVELDRTDPGDPDLSPALDFNPKYPVIRSRPSDIAQLWNLVEDVVRQIRGVDLKGMAEGAEGALKAAEDLLRGERIKQTLLHVEAAAANLRSVSAKADRILDRGEVERLLTASTQAMGEAKNLLAETRAQVKALNLAATGQQAHELVDEVSQTAGGVSAELRMTSESLHRSAETLQRLLERLERSPSDALFSSPPPAEPARRQTKGERR